ncbi:Nucleotidyltransferase domain protein [uncultured archaeon]|nr:Nucleotidyltransferase domain protein [uncultured archaeon]
MFKKLNLFSKTELKVLEFIATSDGELYERQIALKAGISAGSANSILNRFAKAGLVTKTTRGKMSFYSASASNPLLRQFKIFCTVNNLMPQVNRLSALASRIILYGSCANGTNTHSSDIDLFVLTTQKEQIRRLLDNHENIQAIAMDSAEWVSLSKKDKPLYDRINSGITLWEAE